MSKIQIQRANVIAIMESAEIAYPFECCGLLIGQIKNESNYFVNEFKPSPNVAKGNHKTNFEIDHKIRLKIMKDLRDGPNKVIGHYHSHPNQTSEPSTKDLDMAFEPELVWLIIAVENGEANLPRAYILNKSGKNFQEIELNEFK